MQKARLHNIQEIQRWIRQAKIDNPDAQLSREAIIKKAQLVLGCSRRKAEEYLDLIEYE